MSCTNHCEEGSDAVITINGSSTFKLPGIAEICIYPPGEYDPDPSYPDGCSPPSGGGGDDGHSYPYGKSISYRIRGTYEAWYYWQGVKYYQFPPGTPWGPVVRSGPIYGLFERYQSNNRKLLYILNGSPAVEWNLLEHDVGPGSLNTESAGRITLIEVLRDDGTWGPAPKPPKPRWDNQPPCALSPVFPSQKKPDKDKWTLEISSSTWNFKIAFQFDSQPTVSVNCEKECNPCYKQLAGEVDRLISKLQ